MNEIEIEVYLYVRKHSTKHLKTIIQAINDGVVEENDRLRESKSKVEAGLCVVLDRLSPKKLKGSFRSVLEDALDKCTFFRVDSYKKKLKEN